MKITYSRWSGFDHMMAQVPEEVPAPQIQTRFEQGEAYQQRYGLAFKMEHGFQKTEMGQQAYFANLAIISQAVLRTVRDYWHPSWHLFSLFIVFLLISAHKTGLHQNHAGSCQPTQHAGRFCPARTPQQPDSGTRSLQACRTQLWCPPEKHFWYGHGHRSSRRHVQGQNAGTTRRHRASAGM